MPKMEMILLPMVMGIAHRTITISLVAIVEKLATNILEVPINLSLNLKANLHREGQSL